jgi:hypothetical protein
MNHNIEYKETKYKATEKLSLTKVGTGEGLAVLGINVGLPLGVKETGAYEVGFELRDGNDVASTG